MKILIFSCIFYTIQKKITFYFYILYRSVVFDNFFLFFIFTARIIQLFSIYKKAILINEKECILIYYFLHIHFNIIILFKLWKYWSSHAYFTQYKKKLFFIFTYYIDQFLLIIYFFSIFTTDIKQLF